MNKVIKKQGVEISRQEIQRLRLSENEVRVLSVVNFMPQKLAEIEDASNLAHTTVFETLSRLHERGLVTSVGEGRAKRWLSVKKTKVKNAGEARYKDILVLQGKEEILSLISELFISHKGDRLLSFHGEKISKGWLSVLNKEDIEKRNIMIVENKIIVERYVPEHGYGRIFRSFPGSWQKTMFGRTHITYLLPDEFFDSNTEIMMFSDIVMVYETHLSRVTLFRDKETVKVYATLFEMMRRLGRKVNSEEVFKMYLGK
jgi:DNA-binding MarR family transcriptional regulator